MICVQVREVTGSDYVEQTFRLRYDVWSLETEIQEQFRAQGIISDEHDAHARHWAAFDGDDLVASGRLCIHKLQEDTPDASAFQEMRLPSPIATINRLVVVRRLRKMGIAKLLDDCRIRASRESKAACIVATAFEWRVASLQACGFKLTEYQFVPSFAGGLTTRGMILTL